jgi:hypothetical protein
MGFGRTFPDGYQAKNDLRQHNERVLAEETRKARSATVRSNGFVDGVAAM